MVFVHDWSLGYRGRQISKKHERDNEKMTWVRYDDNMSTRDDAT